jgi:hypothetical protein
MELMLSLLFQASEKEVFMPRFSRWKDFLHDVEIAVVGSVLRLDNCVLVVLRMRRGKVPAVEVQIVSLLAMIGERVPRNLPARDTATVSGHGKKKRIHTGSLVEDVEHLFQLKTFEHRSCRAAKHIKPFSRAIIPAGLRILGSTEPWQTTSRYEWFYRTLNKP